ncbi:MAG: serine/threonine-protein kinase [Planctomycetota bacterium]
MTNDENLGRATEVEGYKVLPPCVIYGKIGQGGMGAVYRGRHLNLDIDVAVKCLKPNLIGNDDQFVVRFRREARSAAQINHQNVIRVFDVAEDQGLHYLIMELVQGETARERVLRKQRLSVGEALEIVYGAAQGLAEAHRKGFIHRDIKPDNIMISTSGQVKVADLGLAKPSLHDGPASMLSGTNLIMGTPQYMPPEQWENTATVTAAADVWALGATLYFLLVGGEAIQKDSLPRIMQRITLQTFPDPRQKRSDVPGDVAEFLAKATHKDPEQRFQDAQEFAAAMEQLTTRRDSLRDKNAAPTSQQNTLLSPPPAKTLARIKFWLDEQNQKPGGGAALDPTKVGGQSGGTKQMAPPGGTVLARPSSRRWLWGGTGALLAVAAVLFFFLQSMTRGGRFVEADRLELARQFAEAIVETNRVHAENLALPGKQQRLARLHAAWSQELADQARLGEALEQIEYSLAQANAATVQAQKVQLLARVGAMLERVFLRDQPGSQLLPRAATVEFRGRLADPLVAALKLGELQVSLATDGSFVTSREVGKARSMSVEVTLVRGQTVVLQPWAFEFEAAPPDRAGGPEKGGVEPERKDPIGVQPKREGTDTPNPAPNAAAMLEVEPKVIELDGDREATLRIRAAKGASILIDGVAVQRSPNEEIYLHRVRSELEAPPAIVVVVRQQGFADARSEVPQRRVARALTFRKVLAALVGCRTAPGKQLVTAQESVRIQGQLSERAETVLVDGAPANELQWLADGVFQCTVQLKPGRNDVRIEAQQRFRQPAGELWTVYRLGEPSLALADPAAATVTTAAATFALVVVADEWTTKVTAKTNKASVDLRPETGSTRFSGNVALEVLVNEIVVEASNLVDQRARLVVQVERTAASARPVIQAVSIVRDGKERPVAANDAVYSRRGATLKITASDSKASVSINKENIEGDNPMLVPLARYEDKNIFDLRIVLHNDVGASTEFACRVFVDEEAPQIKVKGPLDAVPAGRPFTMFGDWTDNRGLGSIVVGDQAATAKPTGGKASSGQWHVLLEAPAESKNYEIVVEDLAGNRSKTTFRVEVRGL